MKRRTPLTVGEKVAVAVAVFYGLALVVAVALVAIELSRRDDSPQQPTQPASAPKE